jgi:hypothetical protein
MYRNTLSPGAYDHIHIVREYIVPGRVQPDNDAYKGWDRINLLVPLMQIN